MSDRMKELKAFDDTKLGVKGLVDSGIVNIPKTFVRPADKFGHLKDPHKGIPLIDLDRLLSTKITHHDEEDATIEFINHIKEFGDRVFDLLSESLGLKPDYLRSMQCNEGKLLSCNYYPKCPNPELAIGITEHSDTSFLTILAQDQIGGLQVLNQHQYWVDVEPIPGALLVNIGDFLQLVSNDKFKSSVHRVVPSREARASAALFLSGRFAPPVGLYGPIKELTSEENPPKYRQVLVTEHVANFYSKGLHEKPGLDDYRL